MRYIKRIYLHLNGEIVKEFMCIKVTPESADSWKYAWGSPLFFRIDLSDGDFYEYPVRRIADSYVHINWRIEDVLGFLDVSVNEAVFVVYTDVEFKLYNMLEISSYTKYTSEFVADAYERYAQNYDSQFKLVCSIIENGVFIPHHNYTVLDGYNYYNLIRLFRGVVSGRVEVKRLGAYDPYINESFSLSNAVDIEYSDGCLTVSIVGCVSHEEVVYTLKVLSDKNKDFKKLFTKYCVLNKEVK